MKICLCAGFNLLDVSRITILTVLDILRESNIRDAVDGIAPWSLVTCGIGMKMSVVFVCSLPLLFGGHLIRQLSCRYFFVVLFQFRHLLTFFALK